MNHYPNCRALTSGHCDCDEAAIPGKVAHHPDDAESGTCVWPLEYAKDSAPIPPPHGDPYLSPWQTNPTATPWDGVEGRDLTFGHDADSEET